MAQVKRGLENYLQSEIISKASGLPKWVVGTAIGIAMAKSERVADMLRGSKTLTALGVVDGQGNIDAELVFDELEKQAAGENAVINLDVLGVPLGGLTLGAADVRALRAAVRAAAQTQGG
jgi:hypothetical protein